MYNFVQQKNIITLTTNLQWLSVLCILESVWQLGNYNNINQHDVYEPTYIAFQTLIYSPQLSIGYQFYTY